MVLFGWYSTTWEFTFLPVSARNSHGASLAGLTVQEMALNSYFRQKHLEIKTMESDNEKILTVSLSWTIIHHTDNLIGCEKKWQFKSKAFKWDNLFISKLGFLCLEKTESISLVLQLVIFYLIFHGSELPFLGQNMCLLVATFARV